MVQLPGRIMPQASRVSFRVRGLFCVTAPDGSDLTPRAQKACGLLALLLEAPAFRRSRTALQDKLWSDRDPVQGAASLRTTFHQIKSSFGEYRDVLQTDARVAGLREDAVRIDQGDDPSEVFLDGIDVKDEEFEAWLTARRQTYERPRTNETKRLQRSETPILLLAMPPPNSSKDVLADYMQNAIARGVADWGGVDIRWEETAEFQDLATPVFRLECHERLLEDGSAIHVRLSSIQSGRVCWQTSDLVASGSEAELGLLVNACIGQTIAAFAGSRTHAIGGQGLTYFSDMQAMFQSQGRDYARHYKMFGEYFERDGRGIHLAWQGFLSCWAVGERHSLSLDDIRQDARRLMLKAIEIEPHNALVHALASHIFGFVLREYGVAYELGRRSVTLDRNNVLGWAFLGMAECNLGKHQEAYAHIRKARSIAGEGPHRAFIDVLTTTIGTLTGHANEVASIGETVVALRPDYVAPQRYQIVNYLLVGDHDRARLALQRLKSVEPDFELGLFREPNYPVDPLRRAAVLDLKTLPKLL